MAASRCSTPSQARARQSAAAGRCVACHVAMPSMAVIVSRQLGETRRARTAEAGGSRRKQASSASSPSESMSAGAGPRF
eukprot:scaffold16396_cov69-Phaeocystis_antarctica.AAC.2